MKEVKAPNSYDRTGKVVLFLAGSIEMGKAEDWQTRVMESSRKITSSMRDIDNLLVLNPRRDEWDSSWPQDKNFPPFREQVNWELQAQEDADIIAMHFVPDTKSPITLLELGLFCDSRLIVYCPEGYWKKGNVDIVCDRYEIPQAQSWDDFIEKIYNSIRSVEIGMLSKVW